MAQIAAHLNDFDAEPTDDEATLDAEALVQRRVQRRVREREQEEGALPAAVVESIERAVEENLQRAAARPLTTRLESTERAAGRLLRLQRAKKDVDEAIERCRQGRRQLYQHDGHPRYSPNEMAERQRALLVPVEAAATAARALVDEATAEAERHLNEVQHLDPVELLPPDQLARANALRDFIRESIDDPTVKDTVLYARCLAALREDDRPVLALYARYGRRNKRYLPVDRLAAAALPERAADSQRQEDVRRAAMGLRLKAANAVRLAQHNSEEEANRAAALASGMYSRF